MNVVLFEMGGGFHALPAERVQEVIANLPATPLPFSPPYLDGLINHAGQVLVRIDLALRLGLSELATPQEGMLLISQTDTLPCAFRIQRVVSMANIAEDSIHWTSQGAGTTMVLGEFDWQEQTVLLLDASRLGPDDFLLADTSTTNGSGLLGRQEAITHLQEENQETCLQCLLVESMGSRYALPLEQVQEVVEVGTILPLPQAPREVAGITSLRHQPYLALHLSGLLNQGQEDNCQVMILVELHQARLGILVQKVIGIERFNQHQIHPTDGHSFYHNFLQDHHNRMIAQIHLAGIIDEQRFEHYRSFLAIEHHQHATENQQGHIRSFLSVRVGDDWCAIPLEQVERVVEYTPPDPLPHEEQEQTLHQAFELDGVTQIHGEIVPVSDLRRRFAAAPGDNQTAAYVVVQTDHRSWALAVDRVNRVVGIPERDIEPLADQNRQWIAAVGQLDGRLYSVLNVSTMAGMEGLAA